MLLTVLSLMLFGVALNPIQADFVQCPSGGGSCNGTDNDDIINGTPSYDGITAMDGDDLIFGGDRGDSIDGNAGNDIILGGQGSEEIQGGDGNDNILPGPDALNLVQTVEGNEDNDTFYVLVAETVNCLVIYGGNGLDVANLIGFGPFSAQVPFGQAGFAAGFVHVIDPIAGGDVFIAVVETGNGDVEIIHGLLSPNPTIVEVLPAHCIDE